MPNVAHLHAQVTWTGVNLSISPFTFRGLINRTDMLINLSSKRKRREWCPINVLTFSLCLVVFGFGCYLWFSLAFIRLVLIPDLCFRLRRITYLRLWFLFKYIYMFMLYAFSGLGHLDWKSRNRTFNVLVSFVFYRGYFISGYGTILALGTFI